MCHPTDILSAYSSRAVVSAALMLLAGATGLPAIQVNLEAAHRDYDGNSKSAAATTVPSGIPVDLTYRDLTHASAPVSSVVFDNTPVPLAPSYSSVSFSSNQICGVGNYLQLGGTSRQIQSVEVTLVTWAAASDYPLLAASNPAGYSHPLTLSLYQLTESNQLVFLTEIVKQVLIPWRPAKLPNGSDYPYNGYAFQAVFDFTGTAALPERVLALVSFDTSRAGFIPLGLPGPYDQLNVAVTTAAPVMGADADPNVFLKVLFDALTPVGRWSYPDTSLGAKCPMMRVRTLSTRSKSPPANAGTYEVYATISGSDYAGGVVGNFTIDPAAALVIPEISQQFYTGGPLEVPVVTSPAGLTVAVKYDGSPSLPVTVGSYQVSAMITDSNYTGQGSSTLTINPSVRSWIDEKVASGAIPPDLAGNNDDPDDDGMTNLMEYATNSDPARGLLSDANGSFLPHLLKAGPVRKFVFRRNLDANDLAYEIQCGGRLSGGEWQPVNGPESILSDDGHTRVVEVSLPVANAANLFYRLKVSR